MEGRLSESQAREVRAYVERGVDALVQSTDVEGTAAARRDLTSPLTAIAATPSFVQQYGRILAEGVRGVPADADAAKRINALLLLRNAPIQEAAPVVRGSLASPDSAVRFTAAKVIFDLLRQPADRGPALSAADQRQLLADLATAAAAETDPYVVGKILPAMQAAAGDGGRARIIETLNDRVAVHAENPATGYLPELAEMSTLFLRNLGNFQKAEAAGLCRASARYLKLVSTQLNAAIIPAPGVETARQMLSQCDNILRELSVSQLGLRAGDVPRSVQGSVDGDDFAAVSTAADRWLEALASPSTGIDAAGAHRSAAEHARHRCRCRGGCRCRCPGRCWHRRASAVTGPRAPAG